MDGSTKKLNKKLFAAVERKDVAAARVLMDAGASVDTLNWYGQTPLYIATRNGCIECVELLLDRGANINRRLRTQSVSVLNLAISLKRFAVAQRLLARGAEPRVMGERYRTSLHYLVVAIVQRQPAPAAHCSPFDGHDVLNQVLDAGAPINQADYEGHTALSLAAAEGAPLALVEHLLQRGADPHPLNREGQGAIHQNWSAANLSLLRALVAGGADINARTRLQQTPLFFATDADALSAIVDLGGDINAVDSFGRTALASRISASLQNRDVSLDLLGALLTRGIDPDRLDFSGESTTNQVRANKRLCAQTIGAALAAHRARQTMLRNDGRDFSPFAGEAAAAH
jgi:ankyrin repeat protein